jgi:PadR family transcriptional regulator PadR
VYTRRMPQPQQALVQGTLDLLILRVLALGPLHGLGIADRIAQVTSGALQVKAGSLFPALYRLEAEGWVTGEWGEAKSGRRAKLYTLTKAGRKQLSEQKRSWARAVLAIEQVLQM